MKDIFKCSACGCKHPTHMESEEDTSLCKWCTGEEENIFEGEQS